MGCQVAVQVGPGTGLHVHIKDHSVSDDSVPALYGVLAMVVVDITARRLRRAHDALQPRQIRLARPIRGRHVQAPEHVPQRVRVRPAGRTPAASMIGRAIRISELSMRPSNSPM
jgi:hypothetical protein